MVGIGHILFRCDASLLIGSGHVMRCRTLARELQRRGERVAFLCRRQPGDLIDLLEQEFAVLALPDQPLADCANAAGRDLYRAWLGCSQEQDAVDCLAAMAKAGIDGVAWLVVDHYGLDAIWEETVLQGWTVKVSPKILVIDDLADRHHLADLLLDQNVSGEGSEQRYKDLVSTECSLLMGPRYALLAPEYAALHPLAPVRRELRRVLLFFGGVDPDNLTGRALETLMTSRLAHLTLDVVLGRQTPHRQSVEHLVGRRPGTTLHGPLPSLAGLVLRADLAIGAAGATTWERACLGLPSQLVVEAENQRSVAETAEASGAALCYGRGVDFERIGSIIASWKPTTLEQMSRACLELCDGQGVSRMIQVMNI